jgi:hypothetical protein
MDYGLFKSMNKKSDYNKLEVGLPKLPWRALVILLMRFSCATVSIWEALGVDLGFSSHCGCDASPVWYGIAMLQPVILN